MCRILQRFAEEPAYGTRLCCSWIRDPGWIKIRIRNKHLGSATLEYFMWQEPASVGWCCCWIRDPGWIKIRIRDKHPGSATLQYFTCRILQRFAKEPASVGGDPEAGGHDRVQREAVRHDAAVSAHPLPPHAERALLHAPLWATHGPSRQVPYDFCRLLTVFFFFYFEIMSRAR